MLAQNVEPFLLRAIDQIDATGLPRITQQLFLPRVEAFSSIPFVWINYKFIRIRASVLLQLLLPGGPIRLRARLVVRV